ncbi:MAG: ATP-binding protein [Spirochaetota bacterium]
MEEDWKYPSKTDQGNPHRGAADRKKPSSRKTRSRKAESGKLKIGDHWNAITIIALSQNSPLKAIAEFVENSIDAGAKNVTIVRGKEKGQLYLKVIDDGEGIPLDGEGKPDFRYVATHICDSIKKKLKEKGEQGIQGEFGIGLLSFWTVGERLVLASAGAEGKTYQMEMKKGEQGYAVTPKRSLFSHPGTELTIHPLLPGLRQLNGERIQHYLASELRDRIRKTGVNIKIRDRYSRKEFEVKPKEYTGRMLHDFDVLETLHGEIYLELYLNTYYPENKVSLFRSGTRVLPDITELDFFNREPWSAGYLQGMIDVPFLQLTPGSRTGIVQDENYNVFCNSIHEVEKKLGEIIELEKKVEEEKASKYILKSVQRALKEAFLALPKGEYDWFSISTGGKKAGEGKKAESLFAEQDKAVAAQRISEHEGPGEQEPGQEAAFYEYSGPLYKAVISPASCVVKVNNTKNFRCIPRDRNKKTVEVNVDIRWKIKQGEGSLDRSDGAFVTFTASGEPGLTILEATVTQGEIVCSAESIVTVTESLAEKMGEDGKGSGRGIPGYTFLRATGELWRSRYDEKNNLIVINNGHKDYIYASRKKARKLKYICRLFAKELVLRNFMGFDSEALLERMIELSLYTEENLR